MQRYSVFEFDKDTCVVLDKRANREVCICGNYEGGMDAEKRAGRIAAASNAQTSQKSRLIRQRRKHKGIRP